MGWPCLDKSLQAQNGNKRQRRSLYNYRSTNTSRWYNNHKYIYLPMMEHQNIKKILTDLSEKYTTIQQ